MRRWRDLDPAEQVAVVVSAIFGGSIVMLLVTLMLNADGAR